MKSSSFGHLWLRIIFAFFLTLELVFVPIGQAQIDQRDLVVKQAQLATKFPDKAKRYALVIGVDEYQDAQISRLEGASNDAKALANALIQYAGFPRDQVVLLTSDQQLDHQPTRANILRRLSNLRQYAPKDGLLLISFAGHGIEREGNAYLLPMDAQVSGDIALVEDSAINVQRMREVIRQTGVGQVVIVLDSCRNNPASGRGGSGQPLTDAYIRGFSFEIRNKEVTAFATLYATGMGQVAHEYKAKRQGYFTWSVVEGLKGGAANEKGEVTLAELVRYVQEQVPKRITIDLGSDQQQRPFAVIEGYKADELVISVTAQVTANKTAGVVDPAVIELEFWASIKDSTNPEDFKAYLNQYPKGRFAVLAMNRINSISSSTKPSSSNPSSAPGSPEKSEEASTYAKVFEKSKEAVGFYLKHNFSLKKDHPGTLYISSGGIKWKETPGSDQNDDFAIGCADISTVVVLDTTMRVGLKNQSHNLNQRRDYNFDSDYNTITLVSEKLHDICPGLKFLTRR